MPADWRARLERAVTKRAPLLEEARTDMYRLVHERSDGLDGLLVDRYGDTLRIELYADAWRPHLGAVWSALCALRARGASALGPAQGAIAAGRDRRGKSTFVQHHGAVPAGHVVHEHGRRAFVKLGEADALGTGLFADMRRGRDRVQAHVRGGQLLNLFSHAGGFGVAGVCGGATRVTQVDAARKCAHWASYNLALNGHDPRRHRFMVDDAFNVLAKMARRGPAYRVVVCDPPTTAVRPGGKRFVAAQELAKLAAQSCAALVPGGALLLSTNDRALRPADLIAAAADGAQQAGRRVKRVEDVGIGRDFPLARPDAPERPQKGAWLVLDD